MDSVGVMAPNTTSSGGAGERLQQYSPRQQQRHHHHVHHHHHHHTYPKIAAARCIQQYDLDVPSQKAINNEEKIATEGVSANGVRFKGGISREALAAWKVRIGSPFICAQGGAVQQLFNDLQLYPSRSQVFEMLAVAKRCANRGALSLSFGEFCVSAAELRRRSRRDLSSKAKKGSGSSPPRSSEVNRDASDAIIKHNTTNNRTDNGIKSEPPPYEVFLGGSCNPTTWRTDIAIPMLKKMGITYFNPQVDVWSLDLIEIEHKAKESAKVLFFVLDAETRAAATAVEAAHLAASTRARNLVLVLQPYSRGQQIGGELVPDQEYLDLSRGQAILQEVAERRNLLVFRELESALLFTHKLLREEEDPTPPILNVTQSSAISKHLLKLKNVFDSVDNSRSGKLSLEETQRAVKLLKGLEMTVDELKNMIVAQTNTRFELKSPVNGTVLSLRNSTKVDYETFCSILAEIDADLNGDDDTTESSESLRSLERQINIVMQLESGSVIINSSDSNTSLSSLENDNNSNSRQTPLEDNCSKCGTPAAESSHTSTKWRQLLNNVRAAIFGFVSKIETGISTRFSSLTSHTNGQENGSDVDASEEKSTLNHKTRRKEKNTSSKHKKVLSNDNSLKETKHNNNNSDTNVNKQARKLSVFIPTFSYSANSSSVLTPQSTKRLEGLADLVKDDVAMRDVYLGGSCVVRTSWRDKIVVPTLENKNITYYMPTLNDYNRMFSAPPYTPANGTRFNFDDVLNSSKPSEQSNASVENTSLAKNENLNMTANEYVKINRLSKNNLENETRLLQKHERSPASGDDHPEKRPKYSTDESLISLDDEVEIRNKLIPNVGYPLTTYNRLSASDFYKIPDNASPAPFRGMYDERQIWNSRVLFFGITKDTRCVAPMVLAAHYIGLRPDAVVLCVQLLNRPDSLSEQAVKDYNRGRMYLIDLAKREGVPVFDNLEEATQRVIEKLNKGSY